MLKDPSGTWPGNGGANVPALRRDAEAPGASPRDDTPGACVRHRRRACVPRVSVGRVPSPVVVATVVCPGGGRRAGRCPAAPDRARRRGSGATPAVRAVRRASAWHVLTCAYSFHQTIGLDLSSVLDDLDVVRAQDSNAVSSLTYQATQTVTYCATTARVVRRTSLTGAQRHPAPRPRRFSSLCVIRRPMRVLLRQAVR